MTKQSKKKMNSKVDAYLKKQKQWREEMTKLRDILLALPLAEQLKWGVPCYTIDDGNVVLIHGFKNYCALLFHKGALLKDSKQLLVQQTKNVQSARQLRFTSMNEITQLTPVIRAYVREAIEIEKAGLTVELKKTADFEIPEEFRLRLDELPELRAAFEKLTPGRQRAYLLYFNGAKQSKTRAERVDRYIEQILEGKGLRD